MNVPPESELAELQQLLGIGTTPTNLLDKEIDVHRAIESIRLVNFYCSGSDKEFDRLVQEGYEPIQVLVGTYSTHNGQNTNLYAVLVKYKAN